MDSFYRDKNFKRWKKMSLYSITQSFDFVSTLFFISFVGILLLELIRYKKEKINLILIISTFIINIIFSSIKLLLSVKGLFTGVFVSMEIISSIIILFLTLIILFRIRKKINLVMLNMEIVMIFILTFLSVFFVSNSILSVLAFVNSIIVFLLICDFVIRNIRN